MAAHVHDRRTGRETLLLLSVFDNKSLQENKSSDDPRRSPPSPYTLRLQKIPRPPAGLCVKLQEPMALAKPAAILSSIYLFV